MITKDFKIDFINKKISYNPQGSGAIYTVNELYTYLQELFARRENMRFEIPIEAKSKSEYFLVNGWTIDRQARKHLKGGKLEIGSGK